MSLLYYFDRFTAWLDFSWLVTRPNKAPTYSAIVTNLPPTYVYEIGECEPAEYEPAECEPAEYKPKEEKPKEEKPEEEKSK
jgi:hypothetical protein